MPSAILQATAGLNSPTAFSRRQATSSRFITLQRQCSGAETQRLSPRPETTKEYVRVAAHPMELVEQQRLVFGQACARSSSQELLRQKFAAKRLRGEDEIDGDNGAGEWDRAIDIFPALSAAAMAPARPSPLAQTISSLSYAGIGATPKQLIVQSSPATRQTPFAPSTPRRTSFVGPPASVANYGPTVFDVFGPNQTPSRLLPRSIVSGGSCTATPRAMLKNPPVLGASANVNAAAATPGRVGVTRTPFTPKMAPSSTTVSPSHVLFRSDVNLAPPSRLVTGALPHGHQLADQLCPCCLATVARLSTGTDAAETRQAASLLFPTVVQVLLRGAYSHIAQADTVSFAIVPPGNDGSSSVGHSPFLPGSIKNRAHLSSMPDVRSHSNDTFTFWSHSDGCVYRLLWCVACQPSACTLVGLEVIAATQAMAKYLGTCLIFRTAAFATKDILHVPEAPEQAPDLPQKIVDDPVALHSRHSNNCRQACATTGGRVKHTIIPLSSPKNVLLAFSPSSSQFSIYG